MDARRSVGAGALAASVVLGCTVAANGCSEKKTSETPATAEANARADAGAMLVAAPDAAGPEARAGATDRGPALDAALAPAATAAPSAATAAASAASAGDSGAAALSLDERAAGKTVELAAGQTLTLALGANPTTGFDWSVTRSPAALGAAEMTYESSGNMPGAPGTRRIAWTLKTRLPAGEHPVELGYARSFEKGVAPYKTFAFKVRAAR
jgi:inhibitor of cysteine peptidase